MQSRGTGQAKELQVDKCEVVGTCDPEVKCQYPNHCDGGNRRLIFHKDISDPEASALDGILKR